MENKRYEGREVETQATRLKIMYTNADGVLSKKLELRDRIESSRPDIVCVTETKLNSDIEDGTLGLENYLIFRKDRKEKGGGGVMILVSTKLRMKQRKEIDSIVEMVEIEVEEAGGEKVNVAVFYMPPRTGAWRGYEEYKKLVDKSQEELQRFFQTEGRLILVGDFNCGKIDWESMDACLDEENEESWDAKMMELVTVNMITQHVKEVTRVRGNDTPARLDLIFTKDPREIGDITYSCPLGKSDHVVMEFEVGMKQVRQESYRKDRFNFDKADFASLRHFYANADWSGLGQLVNMQDKYTYFMKVYESGIRRYVPKIGQQKWKMERKNEWFNKQCKEAWEMKKRAWNKARKRRNSRTWKEYTEARNRYTTIRRDEQRKYEKNIVEKCKVEPKLFYRFINGRLKSQDSVLKLRVGEKTYEREEELCEVMNEQFQTVFVREDDFQTPQEESYVLEMPTITVEQCEILDLLKGLDVRKAMGPDGVNGWILKECADQLVKPIYEMVMHSLISGELPIEWKSANIIPIYKGGRKEDPLNYRPISLTSILCKICEHVIRKRWIKFLEDNKMISGSQFGFQQGKSCVTNLLSFYSRVTDIIQEREGWVDCIYLDLKKAFDRVPHKRLLYKLEHCGGVRGSLLEWMKNYLEGRQMRTVIRDRVSSWRGVTSGVPQGSVLAPIMFLIYVNDMPDGMNSYMSMFADDAKLMKRIKNEDCCRELQYDLDKLYEWSQTWKMDFNANKCHVLEMGKSEKRPRGEYYMGNEVIEKAEEEKDLGVTVQNDLSPEKHINKIVGATYRLLVNMRVAFHYMDVEMLRKLIVSIIRPRLEYAAVMWSPGHKKHIMKLERIQRMATRMIAELKDLPYEERLKKLNLPTLEERRLRGDMIEMFKIVKGIEKVDREDLIQRDEGRTRGHRYKLKKTRCLKKLKKDSFPYRCIDVWNELEEEVVDAKNVNIFKSRFDEYRYGDGTTRA